MLDTVIKELADRLGVIERVKNALMDQPDEAAAKLADVLDELAKTVLALDDEIVRYLSLQFLPQEGIVPGRTILLELEGGRSAIRIGELRGHCHKIKNIYDTYLDKWFARVFKDRSERNELRNAFDGLGTSDDYIIEAMKEVSAWVKTHAEQTLDLVDDGKLAEANDCIRLARRDTKKVRDGLTATMTTLRDLQAGFIASVRVV